jgi:plasmid stability protein
MSTVDIQNASITDFPMKGATITLKNVPPELHRSLKELAKKHKRSLNQEAIHCLEGALSVAGGQRQSLRSSPAPASVGKILRPLGDRADRQEDLLDRES